MTKFAIHGHRPGRAGHRCLAHLSRGDHARAWELLQAAEIDPHSARARKFDRLLSAMVKDGFLTCTRGLYAITEEGLDALSVLDRGCQVGGEPQGRAYVFRRAA